MRELRPARLERSLDGLYEVAAHPTRWPEALHELSQAVGAAGALLHFGAPGTASWFLNSEALDESMPAFLRGGWHLGNEMYRRSMVAISRGLEITTEATLFSPGEYMRDPMHMEFLRPHGFGWFAGVSLLQSPTESVALSFQRRHRDEPFSKRELEYVAKALPHMRRATRLASATASARAQGVLDAFSLLGVPTVLLNGGGLIHRMNGDAEALLGGDLNAASGRLVARHPRVTESLARLATGLAAAGSACEREPLAPVRVPRRHGHPLVVHGAPLVGSARDVFQGAKAVLVVVDPDAGRAGAELHLQLACGLTRAEAATAAALAEGLDFPEVAARRGVRIETVRTQAQSVAAKTGVHGRAAQVAFLNRILLRALGDLRL